VSDLVNQINLKLFKKLTKYKIVYP